MLTRNSLRIFILLILILDYITAECTAPVDYNGQCSNCKQCITPGDNRRKRIDDGKDSNYEFSVYYHTLIENATCSGSLICYKNSKTDKLQYYVLSAAHCMVDNFYKQYEIDEVKLKTDTIDKTFKVAKVFPHKDYKQVGGVPTQYDIALILLKDVGNVAVKTLCLPDNNLKDGDTVTMAAYGLPKIGKQQQANFKINSTKCSALPKFSSDHSYCAVSTSGTESQPGDSGSGYFKDCTVYGILSTSSKTLDVITMVYKNIQWIRKIQLDNE